MTCFVVLKKKKSVSFFFFFPDLFFCARPRDPKKKKILKEKNLSYRRHVVGRRVVEVRRHVRREESPVLHIK